MSRNIKEIGKELMGKSLNSFHRKTGLTQLEKNNEMQDGILDGILSQVDDAYIEKTEQSNVIHLDGSGDGVVVLDGIEGNTLVNLLGRPTKTNNTNVTINNNKTISWRKTELTTGVYSVTFGDSLAQVDKTYTLVLNILENTMVVEGRDTMGKFNIVSYNSGNYFIPSNKTGLIKILLKQPSTSTGKAYLEVFKDAIGTLTIENPYILEGDWTNRELPTTLEGIQSSFEDKVNDEGKYEIEILSRNKNLFDGIFDKTISSTHLWSKNYILVEPNTQYIGSHRGTDTSKKLDRVEYYDKNKNLLSFQGISNTINTPSNCKYIKFRYHIPTQDINEVAKAQIEKGNVATQYIEPKCNKIKLLINEPLRAIDDVKDRLCIKDGKLVIERKCRQWTLNGSEDWVAFIINANNAQPNIAFAEVLLTDNNKSNVISNISTSIQDLWGNSNYISETISVKYYGDNNKKLQLITPTSNLQTNNISGFKNYLNQRYENGNPIKAIYELSQPVYEEVLNEYGEPILLEGYENGTIYIDSTIVPTTSVRYTPKMESFRTLKEVNDNNIMLTNDVNDNIIPYMMDVDLMIMEKEMALMSHQYKLRRIGESDMTSMQKRTQDMLTRLIKGKTLTEQECKTRVVTYLDAGKITDAQADELMLLISEVYA